MDLTDEELMDLLRKKHDNRAFCELMNRYQQSLVNHFIRRGVYQEYEDLAQITFFKVYRHRKRFKPGHSFKSWLYTIAQRVWVDHLRKQGRRWNREQAFRSEPGPVPDAPSPMQRDDLVWGLDQLDQAHRDVVVHIVFDQLSHAETAEILGIPEGTVKSRYHHGIAKLRRLFASEAPDES